VSYRSPWEEASVSTALGLGAIAYAIFLLGLARRLDRASVAAALAIGVALSWREAARAARAAWSGARRIAARRPLAVAIAAALLGPVLLLPLYPPIAWDAIGYHLPYAKTYAESGGLAFNPHLRYPVFPQTSEMLFTLALLFSDDVLAQLTQFLLFALLTVGCVAFGRRHFSDRAGVWAAALLFGNSQVLWLASIAYVDMGLTANVLFGVFAYWNWRESGERGWLLLSGAFFGLAMGTKYLGVVPAAIVFLFVLSSGVRARRLGAPLAFAGVCAAVAAPWYVRNALLTGNPIFPFLPRLFGYSFWSAEDLRWLDGDVIAKRGVGRGIGSLLALPWHLVASQRFFDAEERISPLYGLCVPIMAVVGFRWRRVGLLYSVGLAYAVFWFFSAQILRYLVPALPILGVAMAAALDRALAGRRGPTSPRARPAIAALVAVALATPGVWFAVRKVREWGAPATTAEERTRHLLRHRPSVTAYEFLNATRGRDYAVYAFHDQCMTYYADGLFMGDFFGAARYTDVEAHWDDGAALYRTLRGLGATHFLVSSLYEKARLPSNDAFDNRFRLVYSKANVVLYEISDDPLRRALGENRVANGGFEDLRDGWPESWSASGRPRADATGARSAAGAVAVRCEGEEESIFQSVPVAPGEHCVFEYSCRWKGPPAAARLAIVWFDRQGKMIGSEVEVNAVTLEWRRYRMFATVPEGAAYANVCATPAGRAIVWFDEVFFAEVSYHSAP